jgi:hypothetical protein
LKEGIPVGVERRKEVIFRWQLTQTHSIAQLQDCQACCLLYKVTPGMGEVAALEELVMLGPQR